jgi:hypothetical protein
MKEERAKDVTRSIKNFFKDVVKKIKPQINKPESQVKEEKNPFYRPIKIKATHTTHFKSESEAKDRKKRSVRNRMQNHSRKMNRA